VPGKAQDVNDDVKINVKRTQPQALALPEEPVNNINKSSTSE